MLSLRRLKSNLSTRGLALPPLLFHVCVTVCVPPCIRLQPISTHQSAINVGHFAEGGRRLFGLVRGELAALRGELVVVREEVARQKERVLMLDERNRDLENDLRRALGVVGERSVATAAVVEEKGREVAVVKGDLIRINAELALVNGKLTAVTGKVNVVRGGVNAVKGEVNALNGEVNAVKREVNAVRGGVNAVTGEVNAVRGGVNAVKGEVNAVKRGGGVNAVRGEVNAVRWKVNAVSGEVSAIQGELCEHRQSTALLRERELAAVKGELDEHKDTLMRLDVDSRISKSVGDQKTAWEVSDELLFHRVCIV
ncbi:unnamed protein product [Closterium sp. Naga37s-1]|nr:unnamed protein product [Closterium sp. Naga37s-1]